MQSGIVLCLGMVRRGECESLQKRGLRLGILVDTNNEQRLADVSEFVVVERFDFSRPVEELIAAVRGVQQRWPIACLYNMNELYVAPAADVAAALGFANISPDAARLCLDKNLMRQRFQERLGLGIAARFQAIKSEADLILAANAFGYPVFLQPTNVSASMWSTCNDNLEMLQANYRIMRDELPAHYVKLGQKSKKVGVVAAEFLEGKNASIDCVMDAAGAVYSTPVVDVLTGRDIDINDFHHFARIVPSRLSESEQTELQRLTIAGVQALDMTSCAAHVEFIGSRLGEIAARPGGNRPRILELAFGIDELYAYYQALTGQPPDLRPAYKKSAAIVSPFPSKKGTLRAIRHLNEVPHLPGYLYHEVRAQPGKSVGLAKNGYRAPLYIELLADDEAVVRRGVDQIANWSDLYDVE
ncbi:MAG TPA: ATP-grasp domain-containing protein [Planctomycetota bacterium]|nr:ATP-grasp domain-containing protein [Planctomycetota bacterium]